MQYSIDREKQAQILYQKGQKRMKQISENEFVLDSGASRAFKTIVANSGSRLFGQYASNGNLTNSLNYFIGKAIQNGELNYRIECGIPVIYKH